MIVVYVVNVVGWKNLLGTCHFTRYNLSCSYRFEGHIQLKMDPMFGQPWAKMELRFWITKPSSKLLGITMDRFRRLVELWMITS